MDNDKRSRAKISQEREREREREETSEKSPMTVAERRNSSFLSSRPSARVQCSNLLVGRAKAGTGAGAGAGAGALRRLDSHWRRRVGTLTTCEALYSSSRETSFTLIELNKSRPVEQYLKDTFRIVEVTFPDAERRENLSAEKWRVTLLEQTFFGVHFSPSAVLRVWNEEGKLKIQVSELDLSDLPEEIRVPAVITVNGNMAPKRKTKESRVVPLNGQVEISLDVDVPYPFSTFPLLRETVETILGGVVMRLEQSLKRNLPQDYTKWTRGD